MTETIVPDVYFEGKFLEMIYSREMHLVFTITERKMMQALNGLAGASGICFAARPTIASRIGKSERTVTRTINSLVKKGFIVREEPSLNQRHLHGTSNTYLFLDHESYSKYLSRSMSHDSAHDLSKRTFNKNYKLKTENKTQGLVAKSYKSLSREQQKAASRGVVKNENFKKKSIIEERHAITQDDHKAAFGEYCNKIELMLSTVKHRFNPKAFAYSHVNKYGVEAVAKALGAIIERIACISDDSILAEIELWGFGVMTLKTNEKIDEPTCSEWINHFAGNNIVNTF